MRFVDYVMLLVLTVLCLMVFTVDAKTKFLVQTTPPIDGRKTDHTSAPKASITAATTTMSVVACGTTIVVVGPTTRAPSDNEKFLSILLQEIDLACEK